VTAGRHVESARYLFPILALRHSAGYVFFLSYYFFFVFAEETTELARKASERAAGCGYRANNEGHRRDGDI